MNSKTIGMIALGAGVLFLLVSLLADALGLGGHPGIGSRQLLAAGGGAVVAIAGGFLVTRK